MMKTKMDEYPVFTMELQGRTAVLNVEGSIGWDCTAMGFCDLVDEARRSGCTDLLLRINSPGGYCFDGLAMGDKLRTCGMRTVGQVVGLAASMGSYLLECCDERVANRSARLMFHPPSAVMAGSVDDLVRYVRMLDEMTDAMMTTMGERAGMGGAEFRAAHAVETWYSADEAVAAGLLDRVLDEASDAVTVPNAVGHVPFRMVEYGEFSRVAAMMAADGEPEREPEKEPEKEPEREPEKEPEREPEREPEKEPEREPEREPEKDMVTMSRASLNELLCAAEARARAGCVSAELMSVSVERVSAGRMTVAQVEALPTYERLAVLMEDSQLMDEYMKK